MAGEQREVVPFDKAGIGITAMPDAAGDGDVSVPELVAVPEWRSQRRAISFEQRERAGNLGEASVDPELGRFGVQPALQKQCSAFIGQTGSKAGDPYFAMALWFCNRKQPALGLHQGVEIVDDREAFSQRDAKIEDERGDAQQRIICADLVGVAGDRPGPMLKPMPYSRMAIATRRVKEKFGLSDDNYSGVPFPQMIAAVAPMARSLYPAFCAIADTMRQQSALELGRAIMMTRDRQLVAGLRSWRRRLRRRSCGRRCG